MHLILDHYSPHTHRKVKSWRKVNPHFHFTPPICLVNSVEHRAGTLQRHVPARGSFADAVTLRTALGRYVRGRNRHAVPSGGGSPPTNSWPGLHMYEEFAKWCTSWTTLCTEVVMAGKRPLSRS